MLADTTACQDRWGGTQIWS